jgi:dipeptidase E
MIVFLTSSPTGPLDGSRKVNGVDEKNQFLLNLKRYWKKEARCLMITAFPDNDAANDEMRGFFENAFASRGLTSSVFHIWDGRTADYSKETLHSYDVIILGGGHVPTQNAFFHKISLREKMEGFDGMVIGISAGTMNSADEVYVQPEEPGEAIDPNFKRTAVGLGLTKVQILPHYQMVKHNYLDGMRLFEDITYGDSYGREFLALNDGSYLLSVDGVESIHGEAYLIKDGKLRQITCDYQ